jgi:multiple sugar transport system permease protein
MTPEPHGARDGDGRALASGPARRARRLRNGLRTALLAGGLAIFTIWTLFPFVWVLETSLKTNREIFQATTLVPRHLTLQHYVALFHQSEFLTYFRNSAIVAVSTTVVAMIVGVLAAYAITRLSFRGQAFIGRATIVTYLAPPALLFIPLFQVAYQFRLTDRALGLIPIYLIFSAPFCTWLAITYFRTVPSELEDAALVDGATRLRSLLSVFLPLSLPALAVIALFAFTNAWNEFLFALLLIARDSQKTLPVGLAQFIIGDVFQWGPLMAGALLASLPPVLIYTLAQRWVVAGLASGATKG